MIIFIYPPVAKACEPPAGIGRLAGLMEGLHKEYTVLDANVEGLLFLLDQPLPPHKAADAWTKRALRNRTSNLEALRHPALYQSPDRYKRVVHDLGRILSRISPQGISLGLVNYEQSGLSPARSRDLLAASEKPEINPFYPYFRSRLQEVLEKTKPSVAGISLNYLSQAIPAFAMMGFIRREFPGLKIIAGGGLVTSWMINPCWKNPFAGLIDYLVAGPGEYQLPGLLGFEKNLTSLATPSYSDFPMDLYLSPGGVLPYSASSGCYWQKCSFCPEKTEQNPYRPVSAVRAISEMKYLAGSSGPALLHLLDNAVSPGLLEALAADPPGYPWYGFARICDRLADPGFCLSLKKAGCVMLKLGIESGDQDVLDSLDKGISIKTAAQVLKNLKSAGIASYVYLLFGTPPETRAAAEKTLLFTAGQSDCISFLNLAVFNMPLCSAGSAAFETTRFSEGDLSLYTDFSHPAGWDRKHVRSFLKHEFTKHPAVSKILKNAPPAFTSNHAPFFVMERQP